MAEYKLTNNAVEDLSNIWDYTFKIWLENQADKYYEELISNCQEIAENQNLGRSYEVISEQLLGMTANRHICYWSLSKSYVEITRLLHERIDLKRITE